MATPTKKSLSVDLPEKTRKYLDLHHSLKSPLCSCVSITRCRSHFLAIREKLMSILIYEIINLRIGKAKVLELFSNFFKSQFFLPFFFCSMVLFNLTPWTKPTWRVVRL